MRTLADFNSAAERLGVPGKYRIAVISIHGIQTTGKWQKEIGSALQDVAIRYVPVDYGWLWALGILRPFTTSTARRTWDDIERKLLEQKDRADKVSVIAHSFGSYCVGTLLKARPSISFDKIIVCGSILPRRFPWRHLLERGQYVSVLNEICVRDWPVRLAPFAVQGAGWSGWKGFEPEDASVGNRVNLYSGHSDLLTMAHFQCFWLPFLLS
jgi:hypothetical protein